MEPHSVQWNCLPDTYGKNFLAFSFTTTVCGPLIIRSCVSLAFSHSTHRLYIVMTLQICKSRFSARGKFQELKTSIDQKILIERVVIGVACSSKCLVSGFAVVSFSKTPCVKFFGQQGIFLLQ